MLRSRQTGQLAFHPQLPPPVPPPPWVAPIHISSAGVALNGVWILCTAHPSCLRVLVHWDRRAASRADWTAGSSRAIKTAIMAITTKSSMRVNALRLLLLGSHIDATPDQLER